MSFARVITSTLAAALLLILTIVIYTGIQWNNLIDKQEAVDASWAQLESQLQRRHDLIPSLMETVKGSADFEKSTLLGIAHKRSLNHVLQQLDNASRTAVSSDWKDTNKAQAHLRHQNAIGRSLGRLMVIAEQYPNLFSTTNFMALQTQLEGTENRINITRLRFHKSVQAYNSSLKGFPGKLIAPLGDFKPVTYLAASAGSNSAPAIKF